MLFVETYERKVIPNDLVTIYHNDNKYEVAGVACHTCDTQQLAVGQDVRVESDSKGACDEPGNTNPPQQEGKDAAEKHRREDLLENRKRE